MQISRTPANKSEVKWRGSGEALGQTHLIFLKHEYLGEEIINTSEIL